MEKRNYADESTHRINPSQNRKRDTQFATIECDPLCLQTGWSVLGFSLTTPLSQNREDKKRKNID
jgi:hypothetical protein